MKVYLVTLSISGQRGHSVLSEYVRMSPREVGSLKVILRETPEVDSSTIVQVEDLMVLSLSELFRELYYWIPLHEAEKLAIELADAAHSGEAGPFRVETQVVMPDGTRRTLEFMVAMNERQADLLQEAMDAMEEWPGIGFKFFHIGEVSGRSRSIQNFLKYLSDNFSIEFPESRAARNPRKRWS